jgi:hypothetical protein
MFPFKYDHLCVNRWVARSFTYEVLNNALIYYHFSYKQSFKTLGLLYQTHWPHGDNRFYETALNFFTADIAQQFFFRAHNIVFLQSQLNQTHP